MRRLLLAVLVGALSGCAAVGPDYESPEAPVPIDWQPASAGGLTATEQELRDWWSVLGDPALNRVIELAHDQNYSLQLAGLRVLEARAQLGIATGLQYPQTQVASGGVTRIGQSENAGGLPSDFNQYDLGAGISWEIDFWGRFSRGIESADAALAASVAAYDDALVLLTAQVADTYLLVRTLEEQIEIARQNIDLQERSYQMTEVLYRNGEDSELDMMQAKTLLLATRSTLPALESSRIQALNVLSTLAGQPTGEMAAVLGSGKIPVVPDQIALGLPADLVRRRPDVRQQELLAVSQNALVGVATADLYPSISLGGTLGLVSISESVGGGGASGLFSSDSIAWSAGASFSWPFLNYGRIRNNIRVQDARLQQALVAYQKSVLEAAEEVDSAVAGLVGSRKQEELLAETVEAAERSNELSLLRYREGFSGYQRVLDAQQALFTQQSRYIDSKGNTARALVNVYKALGGGWEVRQGRPLVDEQTIAQMRERTNWGPVLDPASGSTQR